MSALSELRCSSLGEAAVLAQTSSKLDLEVQRRIWELEALCRRLAGVVEAVCGVNNIMVAFDVSRTDYREVEAGILRLWDETTGSVTDGRELRIPVVYGGEFGPDLDNVAALCGMDKEAVVKRHSDTVYTVLTVGGEPGFGYLSGLDPSLFLPRLEVPRLEIPAGSIIIAGQQAGIHPIAAPCGWHVLGRTDVAMFDPMRQEPCMLKAGDRITFAVEQLIT